jgi:hypothetical protein
MGQTRLRQLHFSDALHFNRGFTRGVLLFHLYMLLTLHYRSGQVNIQGAKRARTLKWNFQRRLFVSFSFFCGRFGGGFVAQEV